MREKKIRGMKRKTNTMIKRIEEHTKMFPSTFYNDEYWNMLLPVSQAFIDSCKTPRKVKRLCIQTLLNQANHLINIKPRDTHTYRVVVLISINNLWDSQIIIFKNEDYFHNFFNRDSEFQNGFFFQMKLIFGRHGKFQFVIPSKRFTFKKLFMMQMNAMKKRLRLSGS